jgi:alkylation response protein AidB-like acyl-CoA dehydrogenase
MRFALTDEQEMLRDAVRGELSRAAALPRVREWLEAGEHEPMEQRAAAQGWTGIGIAEEHGGQGGGLVELAVVFEELGRTAAPSGALLAAAIAAPLLLGDELLEDVLEGEARPALAVPAGRPVDAGGPAAFELAGDTVSGAATGVLAADRATVLLVPALSDGELRLAAVDAAGAGVELDAMPLLDRSRTVADVRLTGAPARVLEVDDPAGALAEAALRAAVLVAADALGAAQVLLDMTVQYVGEREQFGVPVGSFQAVKHAAAEALVLIEPPRSAVYYAAWSVTAGHAERALHAAVAKATTTAAAPLVADKALFLHGAVGYTWEHDLQLLYKRAKLDAQLYGAPRTWRERVADALDLTPA